MKKKIATMAAIFVFAALQTVCTYGASSPGTGTVISSGQGNNAVQIGTGQTTTVETNSRGQAVIGNTALEFVQDSKSAVAGLPETVVNSINGINSGRPLNEVISDVDLTGYNALVGTHAIVTKEAASNVEKTGQVEMPLYVPNLTEGLGDIEVLFYDNMTGLWKVIKPNKVDPASKTIWFNIPNSGTLSVIYKR